MRENVIRMKRAQGAVRSTSDFVYNEIQRDILTHNLPAGTRLVEAKISKELNVSITPVREVFARLANQGLLTVFPYKGTYVTKISKEYVDDVHYLRINLEKMAMEKAFDKITDEDIEYYEEVTRMADAAYDMDDLYECVRYDLMFHEKLIDISQSTILWEAWNIIRYRIENIQSYTKGAMHMRMSTRHHEMLEALRHRDKDRYERELEEHLQSANRWMEFPDEENITY